MKLTGKKIRSEIDNDRIFINPFNPVNINPHSYNVTLADEMLCYADDTLDMAKKNKDFRVTIPKEGYVLQPGKLYLARTVEHIHTNYYAPIYDGRSSIGRLGIFTHVTAGYIDIGFKGFITLEIVAVQPVRIYPFVKIGQISFEHLDGEITLYDSDKYQNNNGIQASKIWKEFT